METIEKTIIVTGSNKGIGFGIVQKLLNSSDPYRIIMTSRTKENGEKTLNHFKSKFPNKSSKISFIQLDINDEDSVSDFVNQIKQSFGKIDILVNNAGVFLRGSLTKKVLDLTMSTNYFNTRKLTELFLDSDLINRNGKIVFLSSQLGMIHRLKKCNIEMYNKLSKYKTNITQDEVNEIINLYMKEVMQNSTSKNWPQSAYSMSKIFLTVYTFLLSRRDKINKENIQVYSCCPGWCQTDLTKGSNAPKTLHEGAETPFYLTGLPSKIDMKIQGEFFSEKRITSII